MSKVVYIAINYATNSKAMNYYNSNLTVFSSGVSKFASELKKFSFSQSAKKSVSFSFSSW